MSITTITIATVDYVSYASVAEADAYLAVDPVRSAAWAALSTDQKGQKLVAATRRLDQLNWNGQKTGTDAAQPNAWPRTGLTYPDGTAVPDDEVPQAVEDACCLLAGSIAINAKAAESGSSASNTKRVKAGTAEVEFFRPTAGVPLQDESAWALVKFYTTGGQSASLGQVTYGGLAADSVFDADQQGGLGLTEGYP